MRVINEYVIDIYKPEIQIPKEAEILKVDVRNNVICLWALVNKENAIITRKFKIVMTGAECGVSGRSYIGTVEYKNDSIFHIFESF